MTNYNDLGEVLDFLDTLLDVLDEEGVLSENGRKRLKVLLRGESP